jgi:hypothetical protein
MERAIHAGDFKDYWASEHYPWPIPVRLPGGDDRPHTPLNALISGPTVGGNWEDGDPAPRSISERWWDTVCSDPNDVEILYTDHAKKDIREAPGDEVLMHWSQLLRTSKKKCVNVVKGPSSNDDYPQVSIRVNERAKAYISKRKPFDLWIIGSTRIIPLWDLFKNSPTSRLLSASPIVASAVARNEHLFLPRGPTARDGSPNPFDRMMAIHMRRGDYLGQCRHLAKWSSSFFGWNQLPFLPDRFEVPSGGETPENTIIYMKRCWPTVEQTLEKVREAREAYVRQYEGKARSRAVLDVIHVLSDGDEGWLRELQQGLKTHGWGTVTLSRDLVLDSEQTGVAMAVDMEIARKAAVFIGNGVSPLVVSNFAPSLTLALQVVVFHQ